MKTLTIKQPWLYAITDLTKRVENRTWAPPRHIIGQRIALHASKALNTNEIIQCSYLANHVLPPEFPLGAILATAVVLGYIEEQEHGRALIGHIPRAYDASRDPWYFGPYAWYLSDIQKLDAPIPVSGQLGLWDYDL